MSASNIHFDSLDNIRTFTSSNPSWQVPADVKRIYVWALGGGGGGGGSRDVAGARGGAGGGSSYPNARWVSVNPGDLLNITVGAQGNGGGIYLDGNQGQDSVVTGSGFSVRSRRGQLGQRGDINTGGGTFFGTLTPTQGAAGNGGRGFNSNGSSDGDNGSRGQGSEEYDGGSGGSGGDGGSTLTPGGSGGGGGGASSVLGQGGNGGNGDDDSSSGGQAGSNATGYGAGGGGAGGGGYAGGNGSPGLVIIAW